MVWWWEESEAFETGLDIPGNDVDFLGVKD